MEKLKVGNIEPGCVVLGCDGWGERISADVASKLVEAYLNAGGNVLDTARLYTGGKSEEIIGGLIKGQRKNIYISTKCAHPHIENMKKHRLNRDDILRDVEQSLKALKCDYIDILWLHRDDVTYPVEKIMDTLFELMKSKVVKNIGASNWTGERISLANRYAARLNMSGFCASQILYNNATRKCIWDNTLVCMDDPGERKFYEETKMPVFAFSSQAKGFFEKYDKNCLSPKSRERYETDKTLETYRILSLRAKENKTTISAENIRLLKERSKFPVLPVIGPSSLEQLMDTLCAEC